MGKDEKLYPFRMYRRRFGWRRVPTACAKTSSALFLKVMDRACTCRQAESTVQSEQTAEAAYRVMRAGNVREWR